MDKYFQNMERGDAEKRGKDEETTDDLERRLEVMQRVVGDVFGEGGEVSRGGLGLMMGLREGELVEKYMTRFPGSSLTRDSLPLFPLTYRRFTSYYLLISSSCLRSNPSPYREIQITQTNETRPFRGPKSRNIPSLTFQSKYPISLKRRKRRKQHKQCKRKRITTSPTIGTLNELESIFLSRRLRMFLSGIR